MSTAVIILAAGKGTRMKSDLPKVLHKLNGKPMIDYVVKLAEKVGFSPIVIVVGHQKELVVEEVGSGYDYAVQEELTGTASAVMAAKESLKDFEGDVVILCGDSPLVTEETVTKLIDFHKKEKAKGTILTAKMLDPFAYGRIIKRSDGTVERIVEEKDATEDEKKINEVNTGTYCFDKRSLFNALNEVDNENNQHEFYLTDVIEILNKKGEKISAIPAMNWQEIIGVNSVDQLSEAEKIINQADTVSES
jgi:bifunctional UDP-N-acetylglucosamine pyrophosphorylase/glucosamine-1-phosphate N-acetyltransferase